MGRKSTEKRPRSRVVGKSGARRRAGLLAFLTEAVFRRILIVRGFSKRFWETSEPANPRQRQTRRKAGAQSHGSVRFGGCATGSPGYRKEHAMRKLGNWMVEFVRREDGPTAV